MNKQITLKKSISLSGIGLHSGVSTNITIHPANENHGIVFKRIDLENQPTIEANINYISNTARSTTISKNGVEIKTTEHLLAALYGNGIDNALIEIDSAEVPILDGSAALFIKSIQESGLKTQNAEKLYYEIKEPIIFENKETGSMFIAIPADNYKHSTLIDFNNKSISQYASIDDISEFNEEISKARTFCFLSEIKHLLASDLIKGGQLNNALVIIDQKLSSEEEASIKKIYNLDDNFEINSPNKIVGNNHFRYENEFARHKLLDIIGDLALLGRPLKAHIISHRPGHKANVSFAKKIKQNLDIADSSNQNLYIPKYDPNKEAIFNTKDIFNILPQKQPFLMIDKVIELSENHILGLKNTTINEEFYKGHFPEEPVFPGVLQIEAMAQTAGILIYHLYEKAVGAPTYLAKVNDVRFKRKIVPGDTLLIYCAFSSLGFKRGIAYMQSKIFVGNDIASEGSIIAKIEI